MDKSRPVGSGPQERPGKRPQEALGRGDRTDRNEQFPAASTPAAMTVQGAITVETSPGPFPPVEVVELVLRLLQAELCALETAAGRHFLTIGQFTRRGVAEFLERERQAAGQRCRSIREGQSC